MPEVCKVDTKEPCTGSQEDSPRNREWNKMRAVTFKQANAGKAARIKDRAMKTLFTKARKCYKAGRCRDPIVITAIVVGGCDICAQHIPEMKKILQDLDKSAIQGIVPVELTELNYFKGGKHLFEEFGCEGTPCFILNGQEKLYEGRRGTVGSLAAILRTKNPLYK